MKLLEDIVLSELSYFTPIPLWYITYDSYPRFIAYDLFRIGLLYMALLLIIQTELDDAYQQGVGKLPLGWFLGILFLILSNIIYFYEYIKARNIWNTNVSPNKLRRVKNVWFTTQLVSPTRFIFSWNTASVFINVVWILTAVATFAVCIIGFIDYEQFEIDWGCYPSYVHWIDYIYGWCPAAEPETSTGISNEHACEKLYPYGSWPPSCDPKRYVYKDGLLELIDDKHMPAFIHHAIIVLLLMFGFHLATIPMTYERSLALTVNSKLRQD